MKIIKKLPALIVMICPSVWSGMQPMDESEMSSTYGQAIFEVTDQVVSQPGGADLSMLRLTIGARIEINATSTVGPFRTPIAT